MRQRCAARQLAVRRSAGALAATRQQSYGVRIQRCRAGGVQVLLSLLLLLLLLTSATERVELFMRLGVCLCVFFAP